LVMLREYSMNPVNIPREELKRPGACGAGSGVVCLVGGAFSG